MTGKGERGGGNMASSETYKDLSASAKKRARRQKKTRRASVLKLEKAAAAAAAAQPTAAAAAQAATAEVDMEVDDEQPAGLTEQPATTSSRPALTEQPAGLTEQPAGLTEQPDDLLGAGDDQMDDAPTQRWEGDGAISWHFQPGIFRKRCRASPPGGPLAQATRLRYGYRPQAPRPLRCLLV
jgi:hypothetical protein